MSYSDVGCVLKINMNCDACKMKLHEVLTSIAGAYSVTIDVEEGLAKISGEIDPNILMKAVSRNGNHAELKWLKLNSPSPISGYYHNTPNPYGSLGYNQHGYGALDQGPYGYGALDQGPYGHTNPRGLFEGMYYGGSQNFYPDRRVYRDSRMHEGMYHEVPPNYYPDRSLGWENPYSNSNSNYGYGGSYNYYV